MKSGHFYLLIALGISLVVLTLAETALYQFWEEQLENQKDLQAKLPYADHIDAFTDQLVRRVAFESLHDPQIADMLKKQSVKVTVSGPNTLGPQPLVTPALPAATNAAPAATGAHP